MGKVEYALIIVALGLGGVLFALFLLYLVFELFGRLLNRFRLKSAAALHRSGIQGPVSPVPEATGEAQPALVAAVTAAIYCCLEKGTERDPLPAPVWCSEQVSAVWRLEGRRLQLEGRRRIDFLRRQWKGEKVQNHR